MGRVLRVGLLVAVGVVATGAWGVTSAQAPAPAAAQAPAGAWLSATPVNDLPNPYNTVEGWPSCPRAARGDRPAPLK